MFTRDLLDIGLLVTLAHFLLSIIIIVKHLNRALWSCFAKGLGPCSHWKTLMKMMMIVHYCSVIAFCIHKPNKKKKKKYLNVCLVPRVENK